MHRLAAVVTASYAASLASAQSDLPHNDALLIINPEGDLITGLFDFNAQVPLSNEQRIYDGTFEIIPLGGGLQAATTDLPGFNSLLPTNPFFPAGHLPLAPNIEVVFDVPAIEIEGVTANLWHWDGSGTPSFAPAATPMIISKAPNVLFSITLDGSANDVPGFTLDFTNDFGVIHKHVDFLINNSQLAPEGIYTWSFDLTVDGVPAPRIYFAHALGAFDQSVYDAAIAFLDQTFLDPEPICPADLDGDNDVDFDDFVTLTAEFGRTGCGDGSCSADIDGNGTVDFDDFVALTGVFGAGPETCAG